MTRSPTRAPHVVDALLVNPPQLPPYQPQLATPCLTAYLKERGLTVRQVDLNVRAYEYFLRRDVITALLSDARDRFRTYEDMTCLGPAEQQYYRYAWRPLSSKPEATVARLDAARHVLQHLEEYRNVEPYLDAMKVVAESLAIVSAAFAPTEFGLNHFRMRYSALKVSEVREAIVARQENPFIDFFERHLADLCAAAPLLIGISVSGASQLIPALTLARLLKERVPSSHICLGGNYISRIAPALMRHDLFFTLADSYGIGEGELTLFHLVEQLKVAHDLAQVPGLIYRENGRVRSISPGMVEDIDLLPTPSFEGLPLDSYLCPEPVLPLYASRGCYWNRCTFCDMNFGQPFRLRNADRVWEDILVYRSVYRVRYLQFVDSCLSPRVAQQLATRIRAQELPLSWGASMRFDDLLAAGDLLDTMAGAGCRQLSFGLESGSRRILGLMDKGVNLERVPGILAHAKKAGLCNCVFVMIGFPTESRDDFTETVDLVRRIWPDVDMVLWTRFYVKKYSMIGQHPEAFGVRIPPPDESDAISYFYEQYESAGGLTEAQMDECARQLENTIAALFPGNRIAASVPTQHLLVHVGGARGAADFFHTLNTYGASLKGPPGPPSFDLGRDVHIRIREGVCTARVNFDVFRMASDNGSPPATMYPKSTFVIINRNTEEQCGANPSAAEILSRIGPGIRVRDLLARCGSEETVREHVAEFLGRLLSEGMCELY